jgi:hypothetical protein
VALSKQAKLAKRVTKQNKEVSVINGTKWRSFTHAWLADEQADKQGQAVQPSKDFAAIIDAGRKKQNQAADVHTRLAGG